MNHPHSNTFGYPNVQGNECAKSECLKIGHPLEALASAWIAQKKKAELCSDRAVWEKPLMDEAEAETRPG